MRARLSLIAVIILAALAAAYFYARPGPEPSPEQAALLVISGIEKRDNISDRFDKIRELINAHSVYTRTQNTAPGDSENDARQLYRYAAGHEKTPPRMDSAARARLFAALLKAAGYRVRLVTLIPPDQTLPPHSLVEVYNPRTRRWELQDQDYNVFYSFKGSGQRVALKEMLSQPLENFLPCQMEGYCNWLAMAPDGLNTHDLKPYFGAAVIHDRGGPVLAASKARFDPAHSGFCRQHQELCGNKIIYYD